MEKEGKLKVGWLIRGILHRVFIIQINTIYLYCTGRTWYVTLYHCIHNIIIKIKTLHT